MILLICWVISGTGAFIGNSAENWWLNVYMYDDFGRKIPEQRTLRWFVDTTDKNKLSRKKFPTIKQKSTTSALKSQKMLKQLCILASENPEWTGDQEYVAREKKNVWMLVCWIKFNQNVVSLFHKTGSVVNPMIRLSWFNKMIVISA